MAYDLRPCMFATYKNRLISAGMKEVYEEGHERTTFYCAQNSSKSRVIQERLILPV